MASSVQGQVDSQLKECSSIISIGANQQHWAHAHIASIQLPQTLVQELFRSANCHFSTHREELNTSSLTKVYSMT